MKMVSLYRSGALRLLNGALAFLLVAWGTSQAAEPGPFNKTRASHFEAREDGSGVLSVPGKVSLAADYSGASGAEALLVMGGGLHGSVKEATPSGPDGASFQAEAGGHRFVIMTLQSGTAPKVSVDGDNVLVGGQTITFAGDKLVLAK